MDPRGATVLITGASSGIGAAAAQAFAAAGADVILVARSLDRLERLAATLPGRPLVIAADVSDATAVHNLVERVISERGRIDILVNNAGVGLVGPVETLAAADLERVLAVNLLGPLSLIQAAIPYMRQRRRGQIINVSSVVGMHALPYTGGYAASKAAFDRLTEALRMELQGSGIAVTLLRPGTTQTDFAQKRLGRGREQRRLVPHGVPPEAVAHALLRAARREPRVAYVTLTDRLQLLVAAVVPALVERLLLWAFKWEGT